MRGLRPGGGVLSDLRPTTVRKRVIGARAEGDGRPRAGIRTTKIRAALRREGRQGDLAARSYREEDCRGCECVDVVPSGAGFPFLFLLGLAQFHATTTKSFVDERNAWEQKTEHVYSF
jgi:hypothetical protein